MVTALNRRTEKERSGPKNVLNDVDYKTWLQFQKSFERFEFDAEGLPKEFEALLKDYILFFTKREVNGSKSSVLTNLSISDADGRKITQINGDPLTQHWLASTRLFGTGKFDYAIFLLQSLEKSKEIEVQTFFSWLSQALKEKAYSTIFCIEKTDTYPLIWTFANASRYSLQLCDEKILLDVNKGELPVYALQFRNLKDNLQPKPLSHSLSTGHFAFPKYIIPKSPPRKKDEVAHPAKFPEQLIKEFIELFTKENDWVLDIMAGTGSTLIAAYESGRNSVGIELEDDFYKIAKKRLMKINPSTRLPGFGPPYVTDLIKEDARNVRLLLSNYGSRFNYCVTSPPYWNMLHNSGSEGQRARRQKKLRLTYSESEHDLGNIDNYSTFLSTLRDICEKVGSVLTDDGKITIIVKNVKQDGTLYTLAWDLVDELAGKDGAFTFLGYTLWCQDDVPLKPFAIGHHWVSNILHHYCLHFALRN